MADSSFRNRPIKRKRTTQPTPSSPGYRLRDGRTGLDPMENVQEMAFLEGKSLRYLFTGRLRIKSRFWLSIAGFVSIVLIAPVVLYLIPLLTPRPSTTILVPAEGYVTMRDIYLEPLSFTTIYLSLFAVVGVALLLNVILSIAKNNRKQ